MKQGGTAGVLDFERSSLAELDSAGDGLFLLHKCRSGGTEYVSSIRRIKRNRKVRGIPAYSRMQRTVFRPLYTCRSDADSSHSQQTLLSAGKCQPDRGMGTLFLPGI